MSATPQVVDLTSGADDPLRGIIRTRDLIRAGSLSAVEAVSECLRRIESADAAALNAFITVTREAALADARRLDARRHDDALGPLHGVPIAIKDNLATAGCRTTGGTKLFADWIPQVDATVVHALRAAGAIVVGKTNLHEAAFGITSKNPHYGTIRNPRRLDRIAGGSSGGSAAAVAAGLCPGALGTDTGGSVRVPAALCGCVGYKPSIGLMSTDGLMSLSRTCDVVGPIARSVEDAQLLAAAMAGTPGAPACIDGAATVSRRRVGVLGGYFDVTDAETASMLRRFVASLEAAGAATHGATVEGAEQAMAAGFDIVLPEAWTLVQDLLSVVRPGERLADHLDDFGPDVRATLAGEAESPVPAARYLRALWETRPVLQHAFDAALEGADFLVCATTPTPAVRHEADPEMEFDGARVPTFATFIRTCFVVSVVGLPAVSIPLGETSEGLPVGAQIIGRHGADAELLRFASACEAVTA
jgi:aspartyl-tRNA(Asn)/glutamyl-tRNA(Gln) amidotransferase subunit A